MIPVSQQKTCTICLKTLPVVEFLKNSWYTKDRIKIFGRDAHCKECDYKKQRVSYRLPRGRFSCYKRNAKKRGIDFKISFEEFMQLWDKNCEYCGCEIKGIGIDRSDSNGAYEVGNIIPCCTACNIFKSKLGKNGFIELCIKVAEHQKNKNK